MTLYDLKNNIVFEPESHKYYNKFSKKEYISCSTIIKLYSPPFDPDGSIITRKAEKTGVTVEELRKEWDKKRDDAGVKGKHFHSEAEEWVNTGKLNKEWRFHDAIEQISKIPFNGKLYSETMVYSDNLGISGTIDLLDEYNGKELDIWDFKTNKELKKKSFWSRERGGYQMMLHPLEHLMDCNYIHYSLQLEIYALLCEENGYWTNKKTLLYLNPKKNLIEEHPILPLREEAKTIIKHRKEMLSW